MELAQVDSGEQVTEEMTEEGKELLKEKFGSQAVDQLSQQSEETTEEKKSGLVGSIRSVFGM